MKIALDATYGLDSEPSGVGVYCSRIVEEMARRGSGDRFHLGYRFRRFWPALRSAPPGPNSSRFLLEEAAAWLSPRHADLFHGLNQRLPGIKYPRMVATFHDLFMMTGDYSTPEFRKRFTGLSRDAADRSDHVIAVSEFTAGQVSKLLGYPRERISVVHHGVDPILPGRAGESETLANRLGISGDFILHVGAIQRRKNVERLVEAFERMDRRYTLVLAGTDGYGSEAIRARIDASPARGRIRAIGYVDRPALHALYRAAAALAFPSLDEGFGIPVIEAMSAALPVVTSNRSALPEVAGGAALLVDPEDTDNLHDALVRVLTDEDLRERLRSAGRKRAAEFRWELAAERTLAVYREVVGNG